MQRTNAPTTEQIESYIERRIASAPAPKASGCLERPLTFGRIALWRAVVVLAGLVCVCFASAALAQTTAAPRPRDRAEATEVVRGLRKIVTPNGIEEAQMLRIGGIDQYVTIRGRDRRNPVLLALHGGPGYVETPLSWWYAHEWEEYFTVVEWDQRGAGRTYLDNDSEAVAATMIPQRFNDDVDEMVQWLRKDLGKSKIFVVGHSWGSYLGVELARRHPEWLHAYIGTGQAADVPESERRGWAFAIAAARAAHNDEAITELRAIAPYPKTPSPFKEMAVMHRWVDYYGGVMAYRQNQEDESHAARLSPDYTDVQAPHIYDGNEFSEAHLLPFVSTLDLSKHLDFKCPILLFEGRFDRTVNSDVAHEWFENIRAPQKHFVWFEHSSHEPMSEEPGKFTQSLIRYARPLAEAAGDIASD